MGDAVTGLEQTLGAERDAALLTIESVTGTFLLLPLVDTTTMLALSATLPRQVRRATRAVVGLRERAEQAAEEPGEAVAWLTGTLWSHPLWLPWAETRRLIMRTLPEIRERGRQSCRDWYARSGSDARKTPEARARLAAARKRQRAAAKKLKEISQP